MWPTDDSTTQPGPRYFAMDRALLGDSTITRRRRTSPPGGVAASRVADRGTGRALLSGGSAAIAAAVEGATGPGVPGVAGGDPGRVTTRPVGVARPWQARAVVTASSGGHVVRRPCEEVFAAVADLPSYPDLLVHLPVWQQEGGSRAGVGARWRVGLTTLPLPVTGVLRVVEVEPARRLGWVWEVEGPSGPVGGWTLTPLPGGCGVDLTLGVALPGVPGLLLERAALRLLRHDVGRRCCACGPAWSTPELARWAVGRSSRPGAAR